MAECARVELLLGGQKSGKSARAEALAAQWLAASPQHQAVLLATGQAWDDEMHARIARHQADRLRRVPGMATHEWANGTLAQTLAALRRPNTLVVLDCLTLWLTRLIMPMHGAGADADQVAQALAELCETLATPGGAVVVVSNEIGLGVIPLGTEVRRFVDALGMANQAVAAVADKVTLMAAGLPLTLKGCA